MVTLWLAIDEARLNNGAMRVVDLPRPLERAIERPPWSTAKVGSSEQTSS